MSKRDLVEVLRQSGAGIFDPDPWTAACAWDEWVEYWEDALYDVRQYNDLEMLHALLETGVPVPAEIARQLLTGEIARQLQLPELKGPPNRARAIKESPEDVVMLVHMAIDEGYKFPASDGSSDENNAFAEVARRLGCKPSTVRGYWKQVPAEERNRIRQSLQQVEEPLDAVDDFHLVPGVGWRRRSILSQRALEEEEKWYAELDRWAAEVKERYRSFRRRIGLPDPFDEE
ncbi:hypothetical protein [Roseovarius sp.]|uniref:hypothetical protein n=1 Tax=Roseovarius sp. TaxID=1486281 RepID=UPI003568D35E